MIIAHVGFLVLEIFFWDHAVGRRVFAMTAEQSAGSAALSMNQSLYNGFLAAGLLWGLFAERRDIKLFFLGGVVVAGVFGAISAKATTFFIQALPALLAAGCLLAARSGERSRI